MVEIWRDVEFLVSRKEEKVVWADPVVQWSNGPMVQCGMWDVRDGSYLSTMDSLQEYKLSNFVLVTESLTFMAGTDNLEALDNW